MGTPSWRRSRGGRPFISPNRATHLQDKNDLADLNNRLAAYIDKVRNLQPDQTDHRSLIEDITQDLKRNYEAKLADAHAEREQEARGRAQLKLELSKIREEYKELGDSNNRTKADLETALTRQRELEALLNTKDASLHTTVAEKRALETDMRNLKDELTKLNENFTQLKRELQDKTLRKLEAENHLLTLKDKLEFQMNSHAEEKKHLQERYDELLAKSSQSEQGFEGKLGTTTADLRAQYEEQLNFYKEDIEKTYESKLEVIKRELERLKRQVEEHTVERQENRDRIKDLSGQVIDQQTQIRDLERKLAREQDLSNEKDQEMARVQAELQQKVDECQRVIDGDLKMELQTYRDLLEGEERRLHLPPSPTRSPGRTPRPDPGTTSRQLFTPSGRGGKRAQPSTSSCETPGSSVKRVKITQKASARGRIKLDKINLNGKFVRFKNMSDKDQPLTNWCLKGQVGSSAPIEYKFSRGFILKAGQTVTIWAASAGKTQNPPTDLVFEGLETWGTGDRHFSLTNADGEEMARRTVSRTEQFQGYVSADDGDIEDEDDDDEDDGDIEEDDDDNGDIEDDDDDNDRVSHSSERSTERSYNLRSRTVTSERDYSNQGSPAI